MPRRPTAPLLLASPTSAVGAPVGAASPAAAAATSPARTQVDAGSDRTDRPGLGLTPPRLYAGLAALTLALGALSLLAPSTPSYDPWSWNLWAREIIHGHLTITDTGTSWKPLPMLATIPFALAGSAGPFLWLAVARAGAIAAVLMAFRLAYRLTRAIAVARLGVGAPEAVGGRRRGRSLAVEGPSVLAGLLAITMLGFAARGGYITASGLGYSEGLAASLLLVALECHLDGRHRACFAVGFLVALDRPEIWLFWVPYGLWLARRDRALAPVIATAILVQPIAWFLPVYLGSGHLGSSVARAQNPRANSLAYARDPFLSELTRAAWPTMMLRAKIMGLLVVGGAPALAWWARRPSEGRSGGAVTVPALRAWLAAAVLGLGGIAWFVVIAVMTQLHFSGNDRYLVLGAALVDVCAAVGFGGLAVELTRACIRVAGDRPRGSARWPAALGVGLTAAVFALVPGWIERQDFVSLPKLHGALLYQARLRQDLGRAIALLGGRRSILACGRVMTEGFQVPMVAYALDVTTPRVLAPPASSGPMGRAPNVILQTRATRSSSLQPRLRTWEAVPYVHRGRVGPWSTFTHCASGA